MKKKSDPKRRPGNSCFSVRFEPDAYQKLLETFPADRGRSSGVADYIRKLVYADQNWGESPKWGKELCNSLAPRQWMAKHLGHEIKCTRPANHRGDHGMAIKEGSLVWCK